MTYFLFSTYSFIFCIFAIQIEYIYSVSGEVLYKNLETLQKVNIPILEFIFIDPLFIFQARYFVHYLAIPEVSLRQDTSICHLGVF